MTSTSREVAKQAIRYSAIIPVYSNEGSLARLTDELGKVFAALDAQAEAVFVVDGSPDNSLQVLQQLAPTLPYPAQVLEHSRNFGSFPAIRTGLAAAKGDYMGVIAADLQEPPSLLREFFRILAADEADVVVGRREGREDGSSGQVSNLYWALYRKFVMPEIPPGGVDVFGVSREAAQVLLGLEERSSSLVGQLYWIGFNRVEVPYKRVARQEGKSGWSMRKKITYLLDSVFAFTDLPIRILVAIGAIGSFATFVISVIVLISWLTGGIPTPGYTPLMLVLLACTFLLLLGLGIVGNYVWRAYQNTQQRPISITARRTDYDGDGQ